MNIKNINISMTKSIITGIILILLSFIVLVTNFVDAFVTSLLWPLLEGSSEGKTVIFLGLIGMTLILSSLIRQNKFIQEKLYKNEEYHLKYIAYTITILLIAALIGLAVEAYIRQQFGVSFFTILTSMDPNTSTSSPMHSHAYKSVLGVFANLFVPSHINTGSSILRYAMPYVLVILILWPVSYILGLFGLSDMRDLHRIVSIIALNVALIGLLDGGIFSQPFLIGIGFLLLVYFSKGKIGLKYFIKPVIIMGYILLLGMIIEVGGSDTTCHTLTVINQTEPVEMSNYNVTSIEVNGDITTYKLNTSTADKQLIREIFEKYKGKSNLTFMSWNFYTYMDNPTMRLRQHKS